MSRSRLEPLEHYYPKTIIKMVIKDPTLLEREFEKIFAMISSGFFESGDRAVTVDDLKPLIELGRAAQDGKTSENIYRLIQGLSSLGLCDSPSPSPTPSSSSSSSSSSSPSTIILDRTFEPIYRGVLSRLLDVDGLLREPQYFFYIQEVLLGNSPFSEDDKLRVLLSRIQRNLSNPAQIKTLAEDVLYLKKYINLLQTTASYRSLQEYDDSLHEHMNAVAITSSTTELKHKRTPVDLLKTEHEINLLHNEGVDAFENVRGDGSCYYRVVLRGYIEHAILYPEDRAKMFSHLAGIYERELLLKSNSCFNKDFGVDSEERQQLTSLIGKLRSAARGEVWTSLQAFEKDLENDSKAGDDYAMVLATRYLTAQCVVDNQDMMIGEMGSLKYLEGADDMDAYRKERITKMGVRRNCASGADVEGTWVHAGFLPLMLGLNADTYTVGPVQKIEKLEIHSEALAQKYGATDLPHPKIKIMLFLSENHYQLGLSSEDVDLRNRAKHDVVDIPHFAGADEIIAVPEPIEEFDLDTLSDSQDKTLEHWLDAILVAATEEGAPKLTRHEQRVIETLTDLMLDYEETRPIIKEFFCKHAPDKDPINNLLNKLSDYLEALDLGIEIKTNHAAEIVGSYRAAVSDVREGAIGASRDDELPLRHDDGRHPGRRR